MRKVFLIILAFAVLLGGCGGGGATSTTDKTTSPTTNKTKPKVKVPKGPPPKKLVVKDLEKGNGPEAKLGDEVTVEYVAVHYKTGKQYEASWDRGEPFTFELGLGIASAGLEQGIEGMKVGGRRELIIPPNLAYGPEKGTLVFVVDLVAIE